VSRIIEAESRAVRDLDHLLERMRADPEAGRDEAEDILVLFLELAGHGSVVDAYNRVRKHFR
jgi:hypothetical protein